MTEAAFRAAANTELRARVRRFERVETDPMEMDAEQFARWFERVNAEARDDELAAQAFYRERGL